MIAIGSDHGGYGLKQEIIGYLEKSGIEYKDYGTYTEDSCDYPVYAKKVAKAVLSGECEKGILICGTGIGFPLPLISLKVYVRRFATTASAHRLPESITMPT